MKKVFLLGLLIVSLITGYFILFNQKASVSKIVPQDSKMSSRKLFLGARKKNPKKIQVNAAVTADGCEELTNNLETIDFNAPVTEWVLNFDQAAFSKCQLPVFKERLALIQKYCFDEFLESECSTHAVFLRAQLRTRGVEDGEDQELLADLILNEFAGNKPDFKKLTKISEKLMVLDPDQKAYQKLWASSKVVNKLMDGKSAMDAALDVNERVSPDLWNDPAMNGIKMAMATGLEPGNVEGYARGYLSQKSDAVMHEVLGWALWKQNRKDEAISELERAIAMKPKDPWLKEQLKKVKAKGANANSYEARITLGVDLNDLYN